MSLKLKPKQPLKPCPFCGGEAELWVEFVPYHYAGEYDEKNLNHCGCPACEIYFSRYWNEDGVVRDWNTRAEVKNENQLL